MPRFCIDCGSLLDITAATGVLVFECSCGRKYDADAKDTLLYESYVEAGSSIRKYDDFIRNSSRDKASNKTAHHCPKCSMPYLTMLYLGSDETVVFTCTCGGVFSLADIENVGREETGETKQEVKAELQNVLNETGVAPEGEVSGETKRKKSKS